MTQQQEDGAAKPRNRDRGKPREQRVSRHAERHQARTLALQVLYENDLTDHSWNDVLERNIIADDLAPSTADYARRLVTGVMTNRPEIDASIREFAPAYPIRQISPVDRNVLRIAIYELTWEPDVPTRAAINEAVEIAKRYGGDNSARFVNGVTGSVAARVRPDQPRQNDK
jgi:N utilization substance protein B